MVALLHADASWAGPLEGEIFGYRLGDKYRVTDSTRGDVNVLGSVILVAEKPDMPADFDRVQLITTLKSFTIGNIYAIAEFEKAAEAEALAVRYADLLGTMYGKKCVPVKGFLGEALLLRCSRTYELSVVHFKPHKKGEKHTVQVSLRFDSESGPGKKNNAKFKDELDQAANDAKRERLDKAIRDQRLKGLQ